MSIAKGMKVPVYVIAGTTTASNISIPPNHSDTADLLVYNEGTTSVFITSSRSTADTVVFPTAGNSPQVGMILAPGEKGTYTKRAHQNVLYAVYGTGSGNVYFMMSAGE